jgi:acyl carrier protein
MSVEPILLGIAAVAREHLAYDGPLALEARLIEDLRLDSIRLLTLAVEVENHFQICLDPEDDATIETVGDLVAAVGRKLHGER